MEQQTRVSLLGSNLDSLSFQETISKIEAMIEQGAPHNMFQLTREK